MHTDFDRECQIILCCCFTIAERYVSQHCIRLSEPVRLALLNEYIDTFGDRLAAADEIDCEPRGVRAVDEQLQH
jgi:hypothetical protein